MSTSAEVIRALEVLAENAAEVNHPQWGQGTYGQEERNRLKLAVARAREVLHRHLEAVEARTVESDHERMD
jgi:hypothetical protein